MSKELALFKWLQGFNSESHIYRINHLPSSSATRIGRAANVPGGVHDKHAQLSLDDVAVATQLTYINGTMERELKYTLQINQKLSKDIGAANAHVTQIRDALAEWLLQQQRISNFPAFENCGGYRIDTEPVLNLAFEVDNNMARFQIMGFISFVEKRRV